VKLTVGIKLKPTKEQAQALHETLDRANRAANEISRVAWEKKVFGQFGLQKLTYKSIREQFGLSAQVVVRVTAKVADAYKLDKRKQRVFRLDGGIAFDDRILRYGTDYVSIWTLQGRQQIPFVCGVRQRRLLSSRQGESDLVLRKGKWYLFATVNIIEPLPEEDPEGWLGVDFGITRIASDSEGQSFSGAQVRNLRKRHRRLRARLQSKGTKSAKRLLKKRSLKEKRFAKDINHQISKAIVDKAQRTKQVIVLEDLKSVSANSHSVSNERTGQAEESIPARGRLLPVDY
jgi:putative transposase